MSEPSSNPTTATKPIWDADRLRDPHRAPDKASRVEAMFDAIAGTYERVNSVVSLGRDRRWRERTVAVADVQAGDIVLDVCCGTGDLVRGFARHEPAPGEVIGLDFSAQMLAAGDFANLPVPVRTVQADALHMPLDDASVDVISCAFGVRNFADLQKGLEEMARVARPGARVVILEFASPSNAMLRRLTQVYCERVLPRVAAWISREKVGAYRYLARSIRTFESPASMRQRLGDAGFEDVRVWTMNLGSVALYRAVRAG